MGDELDLTGDGGLRKTIIRKGNPDAIVPTKDLPVVYVQYEGSLAETGEVVFNTRDGDYQCFLMGANDVMDGLDIAVGTMKVGEIATITCEPEYAYGSEGFDGFPILIPPNATMIIRAELMGCMPQKSSIFSRYSSEYRAWQKDLRDYWSAVGDEQAKLRKVVEQNGEKLRNSGNYWSAVVTDTHSVQYWIALGDERVRKMVMEQKLEELKKMREAEVEGVAYDLTGDGGVTKEIIKMAKADDAIWPTEALRIVDVRCYSSEAVTGTGEVFHYRHEEHPILTFDFEAGFVMKGWDIALATMKVGDVAKITCKPEYAFGEEGSPPLIPPDATLTCELELVACNPWTSAFPASGGLAASRLEWQRNWEREWEMEWDKWKDLTSEELVEQWKSAPVPAKLDAKGL